MSEEQLTRIETTLQVLVSGQAELRSGLDELRSGQDELRKDVTSLRESHLRLETRVDKVEVGLDEVRDSVKHIAESHGALLVAIKRGNDEILETIGRRLDPLEAAMRTHFTT